MSNAEKVRRIEKHTKTTGVIPTVPQSNDHTDGTWIATDIYEGEIFVNLADKIVFSREGSNIIELGSYDAPVTYDDITVIGVNIGELNDGDIIPAGTLVDDVFQLILNKRVAAVYDNPEANLTLSGTATTVEVGTTIAVTLTLAWIQNDAGVLLNIDYQLNGSSVASGLNLSETFNGLYESIPSTYSYQAVVDYDDGPQLNDNFGDPSGNPIPAGQISSQIRRVYYRYKTWFSKNASEPTTSAAVRALSDSEYDNVNTINIPIEAGDTSVTIVIPPNKTLSLVEFQGTLNVDQTAAFLALESIVQVNGADGNNPVNHKVYHYQPAQAFSSSANYQITLS